MRGAQVQNAREYQRPILIALQAESVGIEQLHRRFNCPGVARYASPATLQLEIAFSSSLKKSSSCEVIQVVDVGSSALLDYERMTGEGMPD